MNDISANLDNSANYEKSRESTKQGDRFNQELMEPSSKIDFDILGLKEHEESESDRKSSSRSNFMDNVKSESNPFSLAL